MTIFRGVPEFQLLAKVGDLKTEVIEYGQYAGRKRFEQAKEMVGKRILLALATSSARSVLLNSARFSSIA